MRNFLLSQRKSQRGTAAVAVALILMFILTVVVFFLNRSLLFEQKTSANQFRATTAFELAEAGMEWGIGMLNDPRKIDAICQPTTLDTANSFRQRYLRPTLTTDRPPRANFKVSDPRNDPTNPEHGALHVSVAACRITEGGGLSCSCPEPGTPLDLGTSTAPAPTFSVVFSRYLPDNTRIPSAREAVTLTARGCVNSTGNCLATSTSSSEATAIVRTVLKLKPVLRAVPAASLTAGGSARICGNFILENTDSSTLGKLVNTGTHIQVGSKYTTDSSSTGGCGGVSNDQDIRTLPGTPWQNSLIPADNTLQNLANTNDGLFMAHFGIPLEQYKSEAFRISGADDSVRATALRAAYAAGYRSFWIDGDIHFSQSLPIGSEAEPVTLVSSSRIRVTGNTNFYGTIFTDSASWEYTGNGTSNIHGAVITRGDFNSNANGSIVYNPKVLFNYRPLTGTMVRIPGSWQDF